MDLWFLKGPSNENEDLLSRWQSLKLTSHCHESFHEELNVAMKEIADNPKLQPIRQLLQNLTNQLEAAVQHLKPDDDTFTPPLSPCSPAMAASQNCNTNKQTNETSPSSKLVTTHQPPSPPQITEKSSTCQQQQQHSRSLSDNYCREESTDVRPKSVNTPVTPLDRKILSDSLFRLDDLADLKRRSSCPPKYEKLANNSPRLLKKNSFNNGSQSARKRTNL